MSCYIFSRYRKPKSFSRRRDCRGRSIDVLIMSEVQKTIYANKTVVTLGAALSSLLVIIGGVMWLTTVSNKVDTLQKSVDNLTLAIVNTDKTSTANTTRIAVVETQYKQILDNFTDVKQALQKLKDRFNIE